MGREIVKTQSTRSAVWRPMLIIMAVVAVYSNSFGGMFIFDDLLNIYIPPVTHPWPPSWLLSDPRPVTTVTFAINYAIGELDVWGYHAVNLAIHASSAILLFAIISRLGNREASHQNRALAAALLWAVHPLNTQAVTYIVQRMESLMGLFYLLSLYALMRGAQSSGKRSDAWYGFAIVASACCMGSKQVGVTLPIVAYLFDRTFLAGSFRNAWSQRWPVYLGLLSTWIVLYPTLTALIPKEGQEASAGFAVKNLSAWDYAKSQPEVILHYLRLSVIPWPLCLDYAWEVPQSLTEILVPAVIIGLMVMASVVALWTWPTGGFLGTTFLIILAPTSSIMPIADLAFEHRMYLSLACLCILFVFGIARICPLSWPGIVTVIILLFGLMTYARNQVYRLDVAMWKDVIAKRPQNTRAVYNLGVLLFNIGEWDEAIPYLEAADRLAEVRPMIGVNLTTSNNNLGTILARRGRLAEAAQRYRKALQATPGQPEVTANLAGVLMELGQYDEAEQLYDQVLTAQPDHLQATRGLWHVAMYRGDWLKLRTLAQRLMNRDPSDASIPAQLGTLDLFLGHHAQAVETLQKAKRLAPNDPFLPALLALAVYHLGQSDDADKYIQLANERQTEWPTVAAGLAWDIATRRPSSPYQKAQAIVYARAAALATNHQNPEVLDSLAAAQAAIGQYAEAVTTANQAVTIAEKRGLMVLASRIRERVKLYESGQPFIRP